MAAAAQAIAVSKALEAVLRQDRGRLMAALTYRLHSFQLAEDALQEASISALVHWGRDGLPHSPQGWLIRVAFRKALDQLRSEAARGARRRPCSSSTNCWARTSPRPFPTNACGSSSPAATRRWNSSRGWR
jgi:predicted RNA polymerase sigma factor